MESATMKDSEGRGIVLQAMYDARHSRNWFTVDRDLPSLRTLDQVMLLNIFIQLEEKFLIEWPHRGPKFRLTGFGVDVIEGTQQAPIAVTFDHSIRLNASSHVQNGNGNLQNVSDFEKLIVEVDQGEATQTDKAEAKSLLEKISKNGLVIAVLKKYGLDVG
jgi:hypothetical protein